MLFDPSPAGLVTCPLSTAWSAARNVDPTWPDTRGRGQFADWQPGSLFTAFGSFCDCGSLSENWTLCYTEPAKSRLFSGGTGRLVPNPFLCYGPIRDGRRGAASTNNDRQRLFNQETAAAIYASLEFCAAACVFVPVTVKSFSRRTSLVNRFLLWNTRHDSR